MRHLIKALMICRRGATAVEYGLIVSLVVITMIAALKGMANATTGMWDNVSAQVTSAR